ncbi:MAG: hypothetical protein JNL76_08325 [Alphaproteobacteria bacterium]|nr:hypothetical protein [Alphaproteobacteria bacterium]
MLIVSFLKWVFVVAVTLGAIGLLSVFLSSSAKAKEMLPTKENTIFESRNNTHGKLSIIRGKERRAVGGTVLVIPLIPIPLVGEYHDVDANYLFYTDPDGRNILLTTGDIMLKDIQDAYYFRKDPFSRRANDMSLIVPLEEARSLKSIALCLMDNRHDLEAGMQKNLTSVFIKKINANTVSVNKDPIFYPINKESAGGLTGQDFLIGFEYKGTATSGLELNIIYRRNKDGHFTDFDMTYGDIFLESGLDLIQAVQQHALSAEQERYLPNSNPVKGIEYRLYKHENRAEPTFEQVAAALRNLPTMRSIGNGMMFQDYYAQRRGLVDDPRRYLIDTSEGQ